MNNKFTQIILFLISFQVIASCKDVNINNSGVDTSEVITKSEFVNQALVSYTIKYLTCGFTVENYLNDPLVNLLLGTSLSASPGGVSGGIFSLDTTLKSIINPGFKQYYYKDDMDYCSNSILLVPCQLKTEDQARALALSFYKDCSPERANFRDKGEGNY